LDYEQIAQDLGLDMNSPYADVIDCLYGNGGGFDTVSNVSVGNGSATIDYDSSSGEMTIKTSSGGSSSSNTNNPINIITANYASGNAANIPIIRLSFSNPAVANGPVNSKNTNSVNSTAINLVASLNSFWMMERGHYGTQETDKSGSTVWSVTQNFGGGLYTAGKEAVTGVVNIVTHPVQTIKNLGNVVLHPIDTGKAIWNEVSTAFIEDIINGDADSRAFFAGRAVGEVVLVVVGTKGVDKTLKVVKGANGIKVVGEAEKSLLKMDLKLFSEGAGSGGSVGAAKRLIYEASPKHGPTAKGSISAAPRNGQEALDLSIQVKSTSPRRVSIDYGTGEFNVFDQTSPGIFHGHVRTWNELTSEMQRTLRQSGMVDSRGRILGGQ